MKKFATLFGVALMVIGYLGVFWSEPGATNMRHNDPTGAGGFPTYGELLERYAARTGRDLNGISFYVAFACWRLAIINEGVYARYRRGAMGDHDVNVEVFRIGKAPENDFCLNDDTVSRWPALMSGPISTFFSVCRPTLMLLTADDRSATSLS